MPEDEVKEKLDIILKNKFVCSDEKLALMKEYRFLSNVVGFSAADLLEIFLEVEKEFGIVFSEDRLLSVQFDNYGELVKGIMKEVIE